MNPAISVYIPVYNREKYIKEAIDSILGQSFPDFELIIVDDGSTDRSVEIINSYTDPRIKLIRNFPNKGVRNASNTGLKAAKGRYIARLDSDDISVKDRLKMQYEFMEAHPEVGICGGQLELFGKETGIWNYPIAHNSIVAGLFFDPTLSQGTSMMRRELVEAGFLYDEEGMNYSEDYELWLRLKKVTKFANLKAVVVLYRKGDQNVTFELKEHSRMILREIHKKVLNEFGIIPTEREMDLHHILLCRFPKNIQPADITDAKKWSDRLIEHNAKVKHYPEKEFQEVFDKKWSRLFYYLIPYGLNYILAYKRANGLKMNQWKYYFLASARNLVKRK